LTTTAPKDDPIVQLCATEQIDCFRGPENDVPCAHNCSLILRTAIALQPRACKILGVRALRAAFRISQDFSSSSHAPPSRQRSQLLGSAKSPASHLTHHPNVIELK
jgi:hypothetical protein